MGPARGAAFYAPSLLASRNFLLVGDLFRLLHRHRAVRVMSCRLALLDRLVAKQAALMFDRCLRIRRARHPGIGGSALG